MRIEIPAKNMLVLGNGFDLHHNMKTRYNDYIDFLRGMKERNEGIVKAGTEASLADIKGDRTELKDGCLHYYTKKGFPEKAIREVWAALENNFVRYFMAYHAEVKGWIDFEVLIRNVTEIIETLMGRFSGLKGNRRDNYADGIGGNVGERLLAGCFDKIFNISQQDGICIQKRLADSVSGIHKKDVIHILRKEFDGLCRSLYLYLKELEPHCRRIRQEFTYRQIREIQADAVVTFNYTDTWKRYGISPDRVIHVHGSLEGENIVLGFHDEDENDLEYVYFKKYMQCILKHTPVLEQYDFDTGRLVGHCGNPIMHFFGHSLDVTDREKLIFLFDKASQIKIYYYGEDDHEEKIEKVIALLGKRKALPRIYERDIDFIEIKKDENEIKAEKAEADQEMLQIWENLERAREEKEKAKRQEEENSRMLRNLSGMFNL